MLAHTPLVSIVLPTYNRANLLGGALESCCSQTYSNLEIIVVDDGSPDHTGAVVAEWAARDPRIRYVRQQNGKIPRALNAGFREARGEFWTWTSDDNLYEPDAIALMSEHLQQQADVGLVYCSYQQIDEAGNFLSLSGTGSSPDLLPRKNVIGACFMYRRSVAEQVGEYDPETFLAEDYDYWMRISQVARVSYLPGKHPYRLRLHPNSLTSLREAEAELQAAKVRARYARSPREKERLMADGFCRAGTELRKIGKHLEALMHYKQAITRSPFFLPAYKGVAACLLSRRPRC